jgi:hypothetical protein
MEPKVKKNDIQLIKNLLAGVEIGHAAEVTRLTQAGATLAKFIRSLSDETTEPTPAEKVKITEAIRLFDLCESIEAKVES